MKNIIEQACYSFLCQSRILSNNSFKSEGYFDKETHLSILESILDCTTNGTNLFVDNPESLAEKKIENRIIKGSENHALYSKLPPSFPFESLCLWFTPKVYNSKSKKTTKEFHFIHTQKLSTNALNLTYAICDELEEISEKPNLNWIILPLNFILTLNDSIMRTPLLPLPVINEKKFPKAYNNQLRKKIINIKKGKEPDSNMDFYSLVNEELPKKEQNYYLHNYLEPGIFIFFFGFLEKLTTNKLKQTPGNTELIKINGEKILPKINFQNVSLI